MFSQKNNLISHDIVAQHLNKLGLLLDTNRKLVIDSRKVGHGDIFCAYPGTVNDGRLFIDAAINNGAKAILFEPPVTSLMKVDNYQVSHLMQMIGIFAAHKYNYPSRQLKSIAVTGTNGKTSISHWLNQAYTFLGNKTGIIGTTGAGVYPDITDYASTTPDPITLQHLISNFVQNNVQVLAMEVSSHALDQGRVNGMSFDTAVFTNLTQDHLDYHKTMEKYFLAKEQLFYWNGLKNAVINNDDPYGNRLIDELASNKQHQLAVLSYGINSGDVSAKDIYLSNQGCQFVLCFRSQKQKLNVPVIGRFNIYNLLAVIATLLIDGIEWGKIAAIINSLKPVAGRMDAVIAPDKPLVVVDYAHTPDALEKALATLKEIKNDGKLLCVFGCGGNRDRSKRLLMGRVAAALADYSIITSDNPRDEEPMAIIEEILPAMAQANFTVEVSRSKAIHLAIEQASARDVLLIAGKGHEDYQEIKGIKYPFSDLELVSKLLNKV